MRLEKVACGFLSVTGLFTSGYLTARAQNSRTWSMQPTQENFPQMSLLYDHRETVQGAMVDVVRVPKEETVKLGLVPLDQQAPLPIDSYMICKPYTVLSGGPTPGTLVTDIGFKCGGKRWIFVKLDIE